MKRKIMKLIVLCFLMICVYLQWGRGESVKSVISTSWDGKRTEHVTIVANKLYIWNKEGFSEKMIQMCIDNKLRDVRFSYDMGYPVEIRLDIYANDVCRQLHIRCCEVRYAQPEEFKYQYNVKDNPEKFTMTVK